MNLTANYALLARLHEALQHDAIEVRTIQTRLENPAGPDDQKLKFALYHRGWLICIFRRDFDLGKVMSVPPFDSEETLKRVRTAFYASAEILRLAPLLSIHRARQLDKSADPPMPGDSNFEARATCDYVLHGLGMDRDECCTVLNFLALTSIKRTMSTAPGRVCYTVDGCYVRSHPTVEGDSPAFVKTKQLIMSKLSIEHRLGLEILPAWSSLPTTTQEQALA